MQSILLRLGVPADAPALAEFAARSFAETFAAFNRTEDLRAYLDSAYGVPQQSAELADAHVITILAHDGDALIGYAQVRRRSPPSCVSQSQPVELHRFYVDRPAHGRGVAQALMAAVHEAAVELGGRHLWLGVWERNPRAIAFYSKLGFTQVGSHAFHLGLDCQTDRVLVAPVRPPKRDGRSMNTASIRVTPD